MSDMFQAQPFALSAKISINEHSTTSRIPTQIQKSKSRFWDCTEMRSITRRACIQNCRG